MKPLFAIRYVRTREHFNEFYRHWFFARPIWKIYYALAALLICYAFYFWVRFDRFMWASLLYPPLMLLIQLHFCSTYTRSACKGDLELYGENLEVRLEIMQNSLRCFSGDKDYVDLELTTVKRVLVTKKSIALLTPLKHLFLLPKDAFTKGSAQE